MQNFMLAQLTGTQCLPSYVFAPASCLPNNPRPILTFRYIQDSHRSKKYRLYKRPYLVGSPGRAACTRARNSRSASRRAWSPGQWPPAPQSAPPCPTSVPAASSAACSQNSDCIVSDTDAVRAPGNIKIVERNAAACFGSPTAAMLP